MHKVGTNLSENNVSRPQLVGSNLADQIYGLAGDDILYGLAGNDLLDGGSGLDTMHGGTGNDTYVVTGSGSFIDAVVEGANAGIDTVNSYVSYTLGANVENLTLLNLVSLPGQPPRSNPINGTGNSLNNRITGNNSNNRLNGAAGSDTLIGGAGNDTLFGGLDADFLDGGLGADSMNGSTGNDTFVVDNAGDIVTETALSNGGIDTVVLRSPLTSYTLTNFVEHLDLVSNSTASQTGTGNNLSNQISGGLGNDTLSGLAGNDYIYGNAGSDEILGGNGNDFLVGASTSNNGRNEIDKLTGGTGNDTFVLARSLTPGGNDFYNDGNFQEPGMFDYALINDFTVGEDKIQLRNSASQYEIKDITVTMIDDQISVIQGAGIYIKGSFLAAPELVGVVKDVSASNLNLSGSSFTYSQYEPPA